MQLIAVQEYLNFGYKKHLDKYSDPVHDTRFSFLREATSSTEVPLYTGCNYFLCAYHLVDYIESAVSVRRSNVEVSV